MIQTLREVLEHSSDFVSAMDEVGNENKTLALYKGARMDAVLVLPDEVAKRYYEVMYVYNTHFVPNGLPGVGMATGDFIEHEGKTFMTLDSNVFFGNMEALHLFRQHEPKFREWHEKRVACAQKVKDLTSAIFDIKGLVKRTGKGGFWLDFMKKVETWNVTSAGWNRIGTPHPDFVDALSTAAAKLKTLKKKGTRSAARMAADLEAELRPFSDFAKTMWAIRKKANHKGIPFIDGDMLALSSPTYSGLASLHNKNADDDLMGAMPNRTDFFMVSGQTSYAQVQHFGGGKVQGENFVMLVPKTPYFKTVQNRIGADESFMEAWRKVIEIEDGSEAMFEWLAKTQAVKGEAVKEIVPGLIAERVLGINMNLNDEPGTALLRPIIAESALKGNEEFLAASNIRIIRKEVETVLVRTSTGYGSLRSVFDQVAA